MEDQERISTRLREKWQKMMVEKEYDITSVKQTPGET